MPAMSVPLQQKPSAKRTGKRITFFTDPSMKEASQLPEGPYYVAAAAAAAAAAGPDPGQSEAASAVASSQEGTHMYLSSVIFSPEKGDQSRGHYQQTVPMKWEPGQQQQQQQQQASVSQQQQQRWNPMTNWGQSFANYIGGVNAADSRTQGSFAKPLHDASGLQAANRPADKPDAYRDAVKARDLEWEQQQQQQQQSRAFQESLKPGALNPQQQQQQQQQLGGGGGGSSVLQPFQLAFGQPKQHLPAYYQAFQGNRTTLPNPPNYPTQPKAPPPPHPLQQQQQQQQQLQKQEQLQRQHIIQQQIQQQQHHQQMQQQQINQHQQHVQQHIQQQQQIQHEQQQQQQQKMQQQQLQQQLHIQQQMQHQQLQQQNPHVLDYYPPAATAQNPHPQPPQPAAPLLHSQEPAPSAPAPPDIQEPLIQDVTPEPQQSPGPPSLLAEPPSQPPPSQPPPSQPPPSQLLSQLQSQLRRSRRLSKEGGAPSEQDSGPAPLPAAQNGARDVQAAQTAVIQSTRRKRRVSQEVNLETLAQQASEMESLPPHIVKDPHRPWSPGASEGLSAKRHRDDSLVPLVIPVSVPVRRPRDPPSPDAPVLSSGWPLRPSNPPELGRADHQPSVIVTRRRSLRNSLSESSEQNGGGGDPDDDAKKSKRRPRPEPLFIPPPKPGVFIAPPVYSSISSYQSHLRSPVRLADNPLAMPPYTPPPILSPVREGSGLYFSTFLSAAAAAAAAAAGGNQGLVPPATPKSATRSLLRSNSCDITPPVLSAIGEATPVSIEPRINIGSRYQAEVPELRQRSAVEPDRHRADLVWAPNKNQLQEKAGYHERVEALMHLACSSVLCGGGTNQELAHHCLHECNGDIMAALSLLMLRNPLHPKSHHLSGYHYSGSDSWTAAERRHFNKGISAYKKDFFMVQKQVTTKTVAQCVEFYYTYKKQVKMGRNGTLVYGEAEPVEEEPDQRVSHRLEAQQAEDSRKWEGSADRKQEVGSGRTAAHAAQPSENPATVLIMKGQENSGREQQQQQQQQQRQISRVIHPPPPPLPLPPPPPSSRPRFNEEAVAARRPNPPPAANKGAQAAQEGEFPCKKCGRIFYKVKSRSAHMKSHAEQEKKAAALRQREAEERAAAEAAAATAAALAARRQHHHNGTRPAPGGDSTNDDSSDGGDEDDEDWH